MNRFRLVMLASIVLVSVVVFGYEQASVATCTGKDPCRACSNCKYCKHCAKNGGTCGICKRK